MYVIFRVSWDIKIDYNIDGRDVQSTIWVVRLVNI